ncbi:MAG TPA: hypothetical protein VK589_30155 [Chryseolinea sp.]|nr:hypothetical protein [Chryseolinea sp.]
MNSFINTSEFLKASPEQRTDMVLKGYMHIHNTIDSLATDIKILNGWLKIMPGLLANDAAVKPNHEEFEKIMHDGADASDRMTEQVIENVALLTELMKAIKFYNNII